MNWELYYKVLGILEDESMHFALSSITGLLVFLSIATMFYVVYLVLRRLSPSRASLTAGESRFILWTAFLYGLLSVWLSHVGLDLLIAWYNAPLGPHLNLILR